MISFFSRFIPDKWLNAAVEISKVLIAVFAIFAAIWWLRYDAKIDERRAGAARCDKKIETITTNQTKEADRRAENAQSEGEALPPVPAERAQLNRLCAVDEACRDRDTHGRRK